MSIMIEQPLTAENYFLRDVSALRESARAYLGRCSTACDLQNDVQSSISLLQTVLAVEIVCVLRYTNISVSTAGLKNDNVGAEFQEQANDERHHMMMAARRIEELGGTPDFKPENLLSRSAAVFNDNQSLSSIVEQNLLAEQSVVEHYRDLIAYFSEDDPTTSSMLRNILRDEENHTADLSDLLYVNDGRNGLYRN